MRQWDYHWRIKKTYAREFPWIVEHLKHYNAQGSVESEPRANGFARAYWMPFDLVRVEIDAGQHRGIFNPHRGPRGGVAAGFRCTTYTLTEVLEFLPVLYGFRSVTRVPEPPIFRIRNLEDGRTVKMT